MAGQEGALDLLGAQRYQVFGSPGFAGNPTTVQEAAGNPSGAALLAHSQSLDTVDNAYFRAVSDSPGFHLRFYSHHGEILVCGHALLAAAQHLYATVGKGELQLQTPHYKHHGIWQDQAPWVSLPRHDYQRVQLPLLRELLMRAGLQVREILLFPHRVMMAVADTVQELKSFRYDEMDWQALSVLSPGALILSCAQPRGGYALRYFSPWYGKPEDPATGSAQSYLAPFWLGEGGQATVSQLSHQGPARMRVAVDGSRIWLSGRVVAIP